MHVFGENYKRNAEKEPSMRTKTDLCADDACDHQDSQIHSVGDGRLAFSLDVLRGGLKRWPCTALCIRPSTPGDPSYNVLLSCGMIITPESHVFISRYAFVLTSRTNWTSCDLRLSLLVLDLSGQIHYWHMTSGMHLGTSKEHDNSIYTIDYHPAGVKYATSGSDCKVDTLFGRFFFFFFSSLESSVLTNC